MINTTIGHYKIEEKLGEGGMGIVYKAHDTKLDRTVALKFLPVHLSASELDKTRFMQEAKAAAILDHPNICTIYSIEEHEGQLFIAMQFVEGQLLRHRMSSMTQKQAIETGIQVAEGLAAAHEKGVVHRDIKPENIMIRKDGIAQIMDFGLAKLKGVSRLTKEGSTVGTAGYMSPEQIQGQDADHRSDIFSLGVLLYEMFTGQLPFKGVHETAIAYEIVNVDATPMSAVQPETNPELDRIVLECLEKDPSERFQSAAEIAKELRRYKRESSRQRMSRVFSVPQVAGPAEKGGIPARQGAVAGVLRRELAAWGLAGLLLVALLFLIFNRPLPPETSEFPIRSSIVVPDSIYVHSFGALLGPPVLSPDGRTIAFTGVTQDGTLKIYVRPVDQTEIRSLRGTEGGFEPFWAPDGKTIGFFQKGRMKKTDLMGGSPTTIASVPNARGGTWSADGTIVFAPDYQSGLFQISSDGKGVPTPLTFLDSTRQEGSHRWAVFLPDGKHFLYLIRAASETGEAEGDAIFVGSLDGSVKKLLVQSSFNPAYADGYLLFVRSSTLFAQRFDPDRLSLAGDPITLQEGVLTDLGYNMAVFSVSATGVLLFQEGQAEAGARPMFLDRNGKVVRYIDDRSEQDHPRFSPDGRQLAVYLYDTRSRRSNIWIYDLQTGGRRRLTTRPEGDFYPVWSRDGRSVYFSSGAKSLRDIYSQAVGHSGSGTEVFSSAEEDVVRDITRDGKTLLVETTNRAGNDGDLWLVSVGPKKSDPIPFQKTRFNETSGRISPDETWVAYTSDESGETEVYLKRLSAPESDPWKISSGGGFLPVWGPGGNELFYVNAMNQIVVADIRFAGTRGEVVGFKPLFQIPAFTSQYDLSPDGKLFVVTRSLEMQKFAPLSLVVNWRALIRQN